MILNLKNFNNFVNDKHSKMKSINNALNIIRPYVYMASINLQDAFLYLHLLLIKNIYNLQLTTCFNLHACKMDMELL